MLQVDGTILEVYPTQRRQAYESISVNESDDTSATENETDSDNEDNTRNNDVYIDPSTDTIEEMDNDDKDENETENML